MRRQLTLGNESPASLDFVVCRRIDDDEVLAAFLCSLLSGRFGGRPGE